MTRTDSVKEQSCFADSLDGGEHAQKGFVKRFQVSLSEEAKEGTKQACCLAGIVGDPQF